MFFSNQDYQWNLVNFQYILYMIVDVYGWICLCMPHIHWWNFLYMDALWRKSEQFFESVNEFYLWIKFTYESNKENIVFSFTKVSLKSGKVITDLYVKPTDCHQYLEYLLAHKNSFVFSQTLCISRLCGSEKEILVQEKGVLRRSD